MRARQSVVLVVVVGVAWSEFASCGAGGKFLVLMAGAAGGVGTRGIKTGSGLLLGPGTGSNVSAGS